MFGLLALLGLLVPLGGSASGATGVALTPAAVERDLPGRAVDLVFTVSNGEDWPVQVSLRAAGVTQAEDGVLAFTGALPSLAVTPAEALLPPGGQARLRVHGTLPEGRPALYGALLATPRRADAAAGRGAVVVRTRVAAPLLLRGPGPFRQALEVVDVSVVPTDRPRVHRVRALLRNTGDVHLRPTGAVRISGRDGVELGVARLDGGVILPGAARRLDGGLWQAPFARGTVRLDTEVGPPRTLDAREVALGGRTAEPGGRQRDGLAWAAAGLLLVMTAAVLRAWRRA